MSEIQLLLQPYSLGLLTDGFINVSIMTLMIWAVILGFDDATIFAKISHLKDFVERMRRNVYIRFDYLQCGRPYLYNDGDAGANIFQLN